MNSVADSLLVRAYKGRRGERPPVWFMRQAGRYLPEYREIRARHSMLDVIRSPELAATVTLQPLERFPLDAAIIFADILNPLIGMGAQLDFVKGEGPQIANPVRSESDVENLKAPSVEENVGYTLEAIARCVSSLNPRGIPLIGFAGAPFTLACYLIQGESSNSFAEARRFMLKNPQGWRRLQSKLADLVSEYLVAQVKAGASAVQLFDSWVGLAGPGEFTMFVEPYVKSVISRFKSQCSAPLCYFGTGCAGILRYFSDLGADVIGVDWRMSLVDADALLGGSFPLQGNLDPILLQGDCGYLLSRTDSILKEGESLTAHIFNVGHGLTPETPIESVEAVVKAVTEFRY